MSEHWSFFYFFLRRCSFFLVPGVSGAGGGGGEGGVRVVFHVVGLLFFCFVVEHG